MKPLLPKIKILSEALALARESAAKWDAFQSDCAADDDAAKQCAAQYVGRIESALASLQAQYAERQRRFNASVIPQATFSYCGKTVKIMVNKPTGDCEFPNIPLSTYEALRTRLRIPAGEHATVSEGFPVVVLRRNGLEEATLGQ